MSKRAGRRSTSRTRGADRNVSGHNRSHIAQRSSAIVEADLEEAAMPGHVAEAETGNGPHVSDEMPPQERRTLAHARMPKSRNTGIKHRSASGEKYSRPSSEAPTAES